jgi:hypothetical protein
MSKCSTCPYSSFGSRDALSDICDGCQNDSDTSWGGFTDHRLGKHFNSEEDRQIYLNEYDDEEED